MHAIPRAHWRLTSLILSFALALTVGASATPAHAAATIAGMTPAAVQEHIWERVNAHRTSKGLPALTLNSSLSQVAGIWSAAQAAEGAMWHNPDFATQSPEGWHALGENVAYGYQPKDVVEAWMNSAGHRSNILNPEYTHLGVGVAVSSKGVIHYTQNFGGYRGSPGGTDKRPASCTSPTSGVAKATGTLLIAGTASVIARTAPSGGCGAGTTKITYGTALTRTGTMGKFTRVSVAGKTWWMESTQLKASPVRYTTTKVTVRSSASSSSKAVTTIAARTSVQLLASSGTWKKVLVSGKTGWVPEKYLRTTR